MDSSVLPASWEISKSSIRPRSSAHGSTPSMSLVGASCGAMVPDATT